MGGCRDRTGTLSGLLLIHCFEYLSLCPLPLMPFLLDPLALSLWLTSLGPIQYKSPFASLLTCFPPL